MCRARGESVVRDLGLRFLPVDLAWAPLGPLCQVVLGPLYWLIQELANRDLTDALSEPVDSLTKDVHGPGLFVLILLVVVGAPIVEELFYRGLLLRALKRHLGPWPAIITCGVIFGLVHFEPVSAPGLALFGVVLAYLAHRTGRLGPSIVTHAAFNALTMLLLVFDPSK